MEKKKNNMLLTNLLNRSHSYQQIPKMNRGPEAIYWNITYKCNLRCKHCLNNAGDSLKHDYSKELSDSEAIKLMHQIAEIKPHLKQDAIIKYLGHCVTIFLDHNKIL